MISEWATDASRDTTAIAQVFASAIDLLAQAGTKKEWEDKAPGDHPQFLENLAQWIAIKSHSDAAAIGNAITVLKAAKETLV